MRVCEVVGHLVGMAQNSPKNGSVKEAVAKENGPPQLMQENLQRNESEPLLDHKNTRSAKHVEIRLACAEDKRNVQPRSAGRKEKSKDRHRDRRVDELRNRPGSQHSEAGSTEYSYSETGKEEDASFLLLQAQRTLLHFPQILTEISACLLEGCREVPLIKNIHSVAMELSFVLAIVLDLRVARTFHRFKTSIV